MGPGPLSRVGKAVGYTLGERRKGEIDAYPGVERPSDTIPAAFIPVPVSTSCLFTHALPDLLDRDDLPNKIYNQHQQCETQ